MLYDENVVNTIKDILSQRKQTIAVAESVTAGHLQAALSSAIEASQFFQGGITAYNLGQKCRHLQVDPITAEGCDCVSEEVARTMALHVNTLFTSHYSIAITGYAAKMPEKGMNELFAWYAIAFNNRLICSERLSTGKERVEAQVDYTKQVLQKFLETLQKQVRVEDVAVGD
jgi:PncC family amidohydrolase